MSKNYRLSGNSARYGLDILTSKFIGVVQVVLRNVLLFELDVQTF